MENIEKEEVLNETEEQETAEVIDLAAEYLDKYKRTLAEFDNFRKRTQKEKMESYQNGAFGVVSQMLPLIDSFERAVTAIKDEDKSGKVYDGVMLMYRQLREFMEKVGVEEIDTDGVKFDPNVHDAIMHVEDDAYAENTVIEEMQKGYTFNEKVLRHSMVKVAN